MMHGIFIQCIKVFFVLTGIIIFVRFLLFHFFFFFIIIVVVDIIIVIVIVRIHVRVIVGIVQGTQII